MAFSDLFPVAARQRDRLVWAWPVLLIAVGLLSSFTFACVTPFAAFATLTAATMRLPRALGMMVAIWLVNQGLGFAVLGYPFDGTTVAWGAVIAFAAIVATLGGAAIVRRAWPLWSRIVVGFVGAFIVYEASLLLATAVLGDTQNFSTDIIAKLAMSDASWLVGIAILRHGLLRFGAISDGDRLAVRT